MSNCLGVFAKNYAHRLAKVEKHVGEIMIVELALTSGCALPFESSQADDFWLWTRRA